LVIGKTQITLEQNGKKQTTYANSDLRFFFEIQGFEKIKMKLFI